MSEEEQKKVTYHFDGQPVTVTVTKGQRGGVGWEISVKVPNVEAAMAAIEKADAMLKARYPEAKEA